MAAHDPETRRRAATKAGRASADARRASGQMAESMARARGAHLAQFAAIVREIDPDGTLGATDPAELARRVRAHRQQLASAGAA